MRISDWSSDVCSSDLRDSWFPRLLPGRRGVDLQDRMEVESLRRRVGVFGPARGLSYVPMSKAPAIHRVWRAHCAGAVRAEGLRAADTPRGDLQRLADRPTPNVPR